ncbi:hypothetical protein [Nostoc punctiforme]|uniref:hypothetical protein n=1 Tax=Nostoc punctiforme TaxID=272131 RepID=UPI000038D78D|nr:hypothetical protein [Nostoc punctiforme]
MAIAEVYRDLILLEEVKYWNEWGVTTAIVAILFCRGFSIYNSIYKQLTPAFAEVL